MTSHSDPRLFVFLLAGGRPDGNTEILARHAASHLPSGTATRWLDLAELNTPPFVDARDTGPRVVVGAERVLLDATLAATDLVIVSPTYWGGLSGSAKVYLDYTVSWRKAPEPGFDDAIRGKTLWGVTVLSGSADGADPLVAMLADFADYFAKRMGGVLIGTGNKAGDIVRDKDALARASGFFGGVRTSDSDSAEHDCGELSEACL